MREIVTADLRKPEPPEWHKALLGHAKALVKMSRSAMSKYYSQWDLQEQVYRGIRQLDKADVKAAKRNEPTKMIVPNTFAQVMTFTSFSFMLLTQNRTYFELQATGADDFGKKLQDCETLLQYNAVRNKFNVVLFQFLLDVARFGLGVIECMWTREIAKVRVSNLPSVAVIDGVESVLYSGTQWLDVVRYEGNVVRNVSPYRFFPDTRFPLSQLQRGEFCACEEEYSLSELKQLETVGEVAGVDFIQPLATNWESVREAPTRTAFTFDSNWRRMFESKAPTAPVLVTKVQIKIVPKQFKLDNGEPLGPEDFPVLYHLWYANDNRIIRCEPAGWWHGEFGFSVGQFTPDMHHTVTMGLADLVYRIQDVISWFVNSHITSVRRVMDNRLIINPAVVDMKSFDGEGHIYLKQGANPLMIDKAVHQLQVADVTARHMQDVALLQQLMQVVTGINDNALGQYASGRRSATEARNVNYGAASRMKLHTALLWDQALAPLGRQMLSNLRQELSFEFFAKVIGFSEDVQQRYLAFKGTPDEVLSSTDYLVFDSSLPSDKSLMANALQELLVTVLSNPQAALTFNINPQRLLSEIMWLRGSGSLERFAFTPDELQRINQETAGSDTPVHGE